MSWYKTGTDAVKALEKQERVSKMLKEKNVPWFRLKPEESAVVILVDDNPFWCEIHTVQIANRWVNLTCSEGLRPCPICQQKGRKGQGTTFYTCIDTRPKVLQDGRTQKYTKCLLPAKRTLAKQLIELKEKYKSLTGLKIELKRYASTDAACGIVVAVLGRVKLKGDWGVPFDYTKVLAPPTEEELEALGFSVTVVGDSPVEDDEFIEEEFETEAEEEEEELELNEEEESNEEEGNNEEPESEEEEEESKEELEEEEKPKKKRGRPKKKKEEVEEKPKKRGRPKKKKEEEVEPEQELLEEDVKEAEELLQELEEEL